MKRSSISAILKLLLFQSSLLIAQGPDTLWTRTYGSSINDYGITVQQTFDGCYIIGGGGEANQYLIKTAANGDMLWTKLFLGSSFNSIVQAADSGYVTAGCHLTGHIIIQKFNSQGDSLWKRTIVIGNYATYAEEIQRTSDNCYIITGTEVDFQGWEYFYYACLLKMNDNGDLLWSKTYNGFSHGNSVQQTRDLGYIVIADYYGRPWLIKTDSLGNIQWSKTYSWSVFGEPFSGLQTNDGGYIMTGIKNLNNNCDIYVIKTDTLGDTLWTRKYSYPGEDRSVSIRANPDGSFVIVGWTDSFGAGGRDILLMRIAPNGDTIWTKTYGGNDYDVSSEGQVTNDGGYIIVGSTNSFGAGLSDIYLIKTAPDIVSVQENNTIQPIKSRLTIFPNPFTDKTYIEFHLKDPIKVQIEIYDVMGQLIRNFTIPNESLIGSTKIMWDARDDFGKIIPPGIYFVKINDKSNKVVEKVIFLR